MPGFIGHPFIAGGRQVDAVFGEGARVELVELGLMEQRLAAVKPVLDNGATVTDVARR